MISGQFSAPCSPVRIPAIVGRMVIGTKAWSQKLPGNTKYVCIKIEAVSKKQENENESFYSNKTRETFFHQISSYAGGGHVRILSLLDISRKSQQTIDAMLQTVCSPQCRRLIAYYRGRP